MLPLQRYSGYPSPFDNLLNVKRSPSDVSHWDFSLAPVVRGPVGEVADEPCAIDGLKYHAKVAEAGLFRAPADFSQSG